MSLINFDNKYNSESLLFSIPVHENHDIINNQIENILNNNPNAHIIIHPNKSFTSFNKNLINYKNVYINENRINYIYGSGLLYIHINNFDSGSINVLPLLATFWLLLACIRK